MPVPSLGLKAPWGLCFWSLGSHTPRKKSSQPARHTVWTQRPWRMSDHKERNQPAPSHFSLPCGDTRRLNNRPPTPTPGSSSYTGKLPQSVSVWSRDEPTHQLIVLHNREQISWCHCLSRCIWGQFATRQ